MSYRYRNPGLGAVAYIIITCIVLWVASSISSGFFDALTLSRSTLAQQPWSLVTSMFLHERFPIFTHILFNMLTLYFFGTFLVNLVGDRVFLLVYFICGIVGNILFLLLAPSFASVVGASGAIFGIGGALMVMRPRLQVYVFPIPAPIPLWVSVIGGFVLTFFAANVAWEAHVGGLVAGVLAGFILRRREFSRFWH